MVYLKELIRKYYDGDCITIPLTELSEDEIDLFSKLKNAKISDSELTIEYMPYEQNVEFYDKIMSYDDDYVPPLHHFSGADAIKEGRGYGISVSKFENSISPDDFDANFYSSLKNGSWCDDGWSESVSQDEREEFYNNTFIPFMKFIYDYGLAKKIGIVEYVASGKGYLSCYSSEYTGGWPIIDTNTSCLIFLYKINRKALKAIGKIIKALNE